MNAAPPALSVADLIVLPKTITRALRTHHDPEHSRLDIELAATAPGTFRVFVRVLRALGENFSIGLRFMPAGSPETVLLRVNGDHGAHPNPDGVVIPDGPHVHSFRSPGWEAPPKPSAQARWAWPLPSDHLALHVAWATFCRLTSITSTPKVDRRIGKLYAPPSAQLSLPLPKP